MKEYASGRSTPRPGTVPGVEVDETGASYSRRCPMGAAAQLRCRSAPSRPAMQLDVYLKRVLAALPRH
jgi:hypothetical protein